MLIRQSSVIAFSGIQGRDSIQIGLGIALVLMGVTKKKTRTFFVTLIVVAGMFHFCTCYLNYQTEWYRQVVFQKRIADVPEIKNGGNYVVTCSQTSTVGDRRFYTWSGNTAAATGRMNTFMLNGQNDMDLLKNEEAMQSILVHYPMYKDYVYNTEIEGNIEYEIKLSNTDTLINC